MDSDIIISPVGKLGQIALHYLQELGSIAIFFVRGFFLIFSYPPHIFHIVQQVQFIGTKSIFVICLTGAFTGMVLGFQGYYSLVMFGWGTSIEKVRDHLGGKALLSGNLDPMMFASGTPQDVYDAAMHVLEVLAPCGGFVLMEGANMVPEAKLENIRAMVRAAEDYGLPETANGTWGRHPA